MEFFKDKILELDKWKELRKNLFRNEELNVNLIALTKPVDNLHAQVSSETLPAFTARQSHESKGTYFDDLDLTKKLITWGHTTPLEAVQFVFRVSGISKSLAGQWTRHRAGIGWTFRSTRYVNAAENNFIYPALEYINDEEQVKNILSLYEKANRESIVGYDELIKAGVKNQEARRIMPVDWSTACYCYVNARSLRHFFELRLSTHAEWEIRRLAYIMFNCVAGDCLTIFSDLVQRFDK